ncbi:MAG: glycerol-3-phosphate dehydrogenase [Azonexus sp.]|nr:glycerol-3-phosphate dehydrogenase [Azonexus sp.]MDZ4316246.1 glycerol-3-phosphate dehydrogenase [Azonexus sp.]
MQDILIVGGGINGAGIARDAAGRGLRVTLLEQGDPGGATSWASSKLLHGGLRYLEHYAFGLVGEALKERSMLLHTARHLTRPLTFVLPHTPELRPVWMLRLGLAFYDGLASGDLPRAAAVNLAESPFGAALRPGLKRGFTYADVQVDDARLVITNLIDARERGARILDRHRFLGAQREGGIWRAQVENIRRGELFEISTRSIINAAGPWVAQVLASMPELPQKAGVQLVRGSHIVVPRLYCGQHAFTLQNDDGRIVFLLPFCDDFTLIGTTDSRVSEPAVEAQISEGEVDYLCRAANRYLRTPVTAGQVVWAFAGIRSLYDDGRSEPSAISREYVLQLDPGPAPALSVFGGKLTTYRSLAEKALQKLAANFPQAGKPWTADVALPGSAGDESAEALGERLRQAHPELAGEPVSDVPRDLTANSTGELIASLVRRHGTRAESLLAGIRHASDLGQNFGGGLTELEARHFIRHEWAQTADDILWRRSKVGLFMNAAQRAAFADWLQLEIGLAP